MSFRPSLTEDERQTLIDVMNFTCDQAKKANVLGDDGRLVYKLGLPKIIDLRAKLFPALYGKQKAETE